MPRFTDAFRVAEESGQTMAEYGVVLALVTLAVLAALTMLGANVSSALTGVANLLPELRTLPGAAAPPRASKPGSGLAFVHSQGRG
jgi:pilus assembly protein Flp/PilA